MKNKKYSEYEKCSEDKKCSKKLEELQEILDQNPDQMLKELTDLLDVNQNTGSIAFKSHKKIQKEVWRTRDGRLITRNPSSRRDSAGNGCQTQKDQQVAGNHDTRK